MTANDRHVRPPDTTHHENPRRCNRGNVQIDRDVRPSSVDMSGSKRRKHCFLCDEKPSIAFNLTLSLVGFITLLSAVFIGFYYVYVSQSAMRQIEKTADKTIGSIVVALEIPLWDVDRENIHTICNAFFHNDWVVMVKLTGVSGEVMFDKRIVRSKYFKNEIRRIREIYHKGEAIGVVEISLSAVESRKERLRSLRVTVGAILICVIGLIAFTGFLLKKNLKEPLEALGRLAKAYTGGEYHPRIKLTPYREFEPLMQVLFEMGETIETQMNELKAAELFLKRHRDSLEETVAERTRSLALSNEKLQHEIARRQEAQEALREKDRLQGVLELSGAVSHEMNQPLMSVMGYFDLMQMDMSEDDPNFQRIHRIREQLERMANITKKLMEISRYETKAYLDGRIVDLSKSSDNE